MSFKPQMHITINVKTLNKIIHGDSMIMLLFLFQELVVNTKIGVCQVPVPMEEHAALCLVEATHVHVSLVTLVFAALMTQTNVQSRRLFAKTKALVSTLRAPTSEIFIEA